MESRNANEKREFDNLCITCRIKVILGVHNQTSHKDVISKLKKLTRRISKPCTDQFDTFPNEKHCPYGSLVDEYPGIPMGREEAEGMNEFNRELLSKGTWWDGKPLDEEGRAVLQEEVDSFEPSDYPELPDEINMVRCECFECACPAFFPMRLSALKKMA